MRLETAGLNLLAFSLKNLTGGLRAGTEAWEKACTGKGFEDVMLPTNKRLIVLGPQHPR